MKEQMLFNQFAWLLFIMPFIGLLASGLVKRQNPKIIGNKILRHDAPPGSRTGAMHWERWSV